MATIPVPTDGDDIVTSWGQDVAEAINATTYDEGFMPFAFPIGMTPGQASSGTSALAAVSGGNAGAALAPILLHAPMKIQSVTIRNGDTATARSCEFRLYRDKGASTLTFVTGTDGTLSFTPSAASDRTGNVSTPGTLLVPGVYWLAIRNTSASQTFALRRFATTELDANHGKVIAAASVPALGATLDPSGITSVNMIISCRLNGRVFADAAAF